MKTRKTVSFDDWVFNRFISDSANYSARIQKLVILGAEYEIKTTDQDKNQLLKIIQELDNLKAENKQKDLTIASLKAKIKNKPTKNNSLVNEQGLIKCFHCGDGVTQKSRVDYNCKIYCRDCYRNNILYDHEGVK